MTVTTVPVTLPATLRPFAEAPADALRRVRFVLTDMDDTLTHHGRLSAATYGALERLQAAGIKVIPVTAAPAGWCDQMARMWPVDGVIGENGGLALFRRDDGSVSARYAVADDRRRGDRERLARLQADILQAVPGVELADDQPFRLTSLALRLPTDPALTEAVVARFRAAGASVTINSLWVLGWFGGYDKLSAARVVMAGEYGVDIERERDAFIYSGDSTNDSPMFGFFPNSVGVSTVTRFLAGMPHHPTWITQGPGGAGFVEMADALLAAHG